MVGTNWTLKQGSSLSVKLHGCCARLASGWNRTFNSNDKHTLFCDLQTRLYSSIRKTKTFVINYTILFGEKNCCTFKRNKS